MFRKILQRFRNKFGMTKKAFTLAEVLITLAIIGVVAALTIPTLVTNYQKKQWVSGLQKGYATMTNVFKMAMATDGVDSITQTTLWKALPNTEWNGMPPNEDYSAFIAELSKYLKVQKTCGPIDSDEQDPCFVKYKLLDGGYDGMEGDLSNGARLKIYSADGIVYFLRLFADGIWEKLNSKSIGRIDIDVNGDNPPNQYGRDLFEVLLFDNGKLLFPGTQEWVDRDLGSHWDEYLCDPTAPSSWQGDYCGARIFEQGWKMDY